MVTKYLGVVSLLLVVLLVSTDVASARSSARLQLGQRRACHFAARQKYGNHASHSEIFAAVNRCMIHGWDAV